MRRAYVGIATVATIAGLVAVAPTASAGKPPPPPPSTTSVIQFQNASYTFTEGNSDLTVAVTLVRNISSTVATADVSAASGSASAADWAHAGVLNGDGEQVATFGIGQTAAQVTFTIVGDLLDEPTETVKLSLAGTSSNAQLGKRKTANLNIQDNDPSPTVSAADDSSTEGSVVDFVVSLSSASPVLPISVSYATSPGTAAAGDDYTHTTGSLVWGPGDTTTRTVSVPTALDTVDEPDQTFTLVFSNLVNVSGGAPATGTILDDDAAPGVTLVGEGPVWEGGTAKFHAVLDAVSEYDVDVDLNTWDTTDPDGWYTPTTGTVTVPAGALTSDSLSVPTRAPDDVADANRTLWVEITAATNATPGYPWAPVTVMDADPATLTASNDSGGLAEVGPFGDNQIVNVTAHVANASGDALDGHMVRFEVFRDVLLADGDVDQIDMGASFVDPALPPGTLLAAFAISGAGAAAGGAPITAAAGDAVFGPPTAGFLGFTNYGQERWDTVVACVVPDQATPCGVTGIDADPFSGDDTTLGPATQTPSDSTTLLWLDLIP